MAVWEVKIEPEGDENPSDEGRNENALIVVLERPAEGDEREPVRAEVARVLYVRRNSKNPRTTFKAQLRKTLETAYAARDALNGTDGDLEVLKQEAEEKRQAMLEAERRRDAAVQQQKAQERERLAAVKNEGKV